MPALTICNHCHPPSELFRRVQALSSGCSTPGQGVAKGGFEAGDQAKSAPDTAPQRRSQGLSAFFYCLSSPHDAILMSGVPEGTKSKAVYEMRILIVEDEQKAANYLRKGLTENGFSVGRIIIRHYMLY